MHAFKSLVMKIDMSKYFHKLLIFLSIVFSVFCIRIIMCFSGISTNSVLVCVLYACHDKLFHDLFVFIFSRA